MKCNRNISLLFFPLSFPPLRPTYFPLSSLPPTAPHFSLCLSSVEFKKSYENDSQSSDNINFLRVGWSNKQLTTLKPLLSEIEYLQDQHLLLTVKSLDGYESYGIKRVFIFVLSLCHSFKLTFSQQTTTMCVFFPC